MVARVASWVDDCEVPQRLTGQRRIGIGAGGAIGALTVFEKNAWLARSTRWSTRRAKCLLRLCRAADKNTGQHDSGVQIPSNKLMFFPSLNPDL